MGTFISAVARQNVSRTIIIVYTYICFKAITHDTRQYSILTQIFGHKYLARWSAAVVIILRTMTTYLRAGALFRIGAKIISQTVQYFILRVENQNRKTISGMCLKKNSPASESWLSARYSIIIRRCKIK